MKTYRVEIIDCEQFKLAIQDVNYFLAEALQEVGCKIVTIELLIRIEPKP